MQMMIIKRKFDDLTEDRSKAIIL